VGQETLHGALWAVIAFFDLASDTSLFDELLGGIEVVQKKSMDPVQRVQCLQHFGRRIPRVPHQLAHGVEVLLFDMAIVILLPRPGPGQCHGMVGVLAIGDHRMVYELAPAIRMQMHERERHGRAEGVEPQVDPFERAVLHGITLGPARADVGHAQSERAISGQEPSVVANGVDLRMARRTALPFVEGPYGHKVLERLPGPGIGMPAKVIFFPLGGEHPVGGRRADGRKAPDLPWGGMKEPVVAEKGKGRPDEGHKALPAEEIKALPEDLQDAQHILAVDDGPAALRLLCGFPGWGSPARLNLSFVPPCPEQIGGVIAVVPACGAELIQQRGLVFSFSRSVSVNGSLGQFASCFHAHLHKSPHILEYVGLDFGYEATTWVGLEY